MAGEARGIELPKCILTAERAGDMAGHLPVMDASLAHRLSQQQRGSSSDGM